MSDEKVKVKETSKEYELSVADLVPAKGEDEAFFVIPNVE